MKKLIIAVVALLSLITTNGYGGRIFHFPLEHFPVQVYPEELGSVTVTPKFAEIKTGGTVTLRSIIYAQLNGTLTDQIVDYFNRGSITWTWSVVGGQGEIVPVGERGTTAVFTAPLEEGTCTVVVIVEEPLVSFPDPRYPEKIVHDVSTETVAVSATATVVVKAPKATSLQLQPTAIVLPVDGTQTLFIEVRDQWGDEMPQMEGTFSTNVGIISPQIGTHCVFYAQTQTTIGWVNVEVNGLMATSTATLIPGPLYKIVLVPSSATLNLSETQTFVAEAFDKYKNPIDNITPNWSIEDDSLGTLSVLTGISTVFAATNTGVGGTTTLSAEAEGVVGTGSIYVLGNFIRQIDTQMAGEPFEVEVTFANFEGVASLTARLIDSDQEFNLGTISVVAGKGNGTVTLFKSGSYTVHARNSFGTLTSNIFLVNPGELATFTVTGIPAIVINGRCSDYFTVTVTLLDAYGNPTPAKYRTTIYFIGWIPGDNESFYEVQRSIRYGSQDKLYIVPGDCKVSLPSEVRPSYRSFFKESSGSYYLVEKCAEGKVIIITGVLETTY